MVHAVTAAELPCVNPWCRSCCVLWAKVAGQAVPGQELPHRRPGANPCSCSFMRSVTPVMITHVGGQGPELGERMPQSSASGRVDSKHLGIMWGWNTLNLAGCRYVDAAGASARTGHAERDHHAGRAPADHAPGRRPSSRAWLPEQGRSPFPAGAAVRQRLRPLHAAPAAAVRCLFSVKALKDCLQALLSPSMMWRNHCVGCLLLLSGVLPLPSVRRAVVKFVIWCGWCRYGVQPYVVHATFQRDENAGKLSRFREWGWWLQVGRRL